MCKTESSCNSICQNSFLPVQLLFEHVKYPLGSCLVCRLNRTEWLQECSDHIVVPISTFLDIVCTRLHRMGTQFCSVSSTLKTRVIEQYRLTCQSIASLWVEIDTHKHTDSSSQYRHFAGLAFTLLAMVHGLVPKANAIYSIC